MSDIYPNNLDLIKSAMVLNRILELYTNFVNDNIDNIHNKNITVVEEVN